MLKFLTKKKNCFLLKQKQQCFLDFKISLSGVISDRIRSVYRYIKLRKLIKQCSANLADSDSGTYKSLQVKKAYAVLVINKTATC